MKKKVLGIIPARYASSRFPGKPLVDIKGKSMIRRVYENAIKTGVLSDVLVATDDKRIESHCREFSIPCVMTSDAHPSGTDRCMEAYHKYGVHADYILNIQGDEPMLHPEQVKSLAESCTGSEEIITQYIECQTSEEIFSESEVKIVLDKNNEALYFSRKPIPHLHKIPQADWYLYKKHLRHVGMYAYRVDILEKITELAPSFLELSEGLEQLRWLENGYRIKCIPTKYDSHCVDTPEDLEKILKLLEE
ncbi:MAG: 3-deoxy-manno-octulosonate cytidylyltransferase [Bacteroidia bacterium]|nr:3-deoxy-manno-octulosonate cytidylyltransferase [Bacteroidia bacterium]